MPIVNSYIPSSQLFHDLKSMDRDNFSYEGAKALMEYLDQLSEDIDQNIEYDPIAFCCDFSEYGDIDDIKEVYSHSDIQSLEHLMELTTVIEFPGGIIIKDF